MKLVEFYYDDGSWRLKNLHLKQSNLLVGRNSTGKSRTVSLINLMFRFIAQKSELKQGRIWKMKFIKNDGQTINYSFVADFMDAKILSESIQIDGEEVLSRKYDADENTGKATIKSVLTNQFDEVFPPNNKLTLHVRRDTKNYPFLEDIVNWAEESYGFRFGNSDSNEDSNLLEYQPLVTIEHVPITLSNLSDEERQSIILSINTLGYTIDDINVNKNENNTSYFYIKEKGVGKLSQFKLSQGLLRALAIITYIEYLISKRKPATILIDDLCEGLDYERAIKLGKLIFEKCKKHNIQLIATTNDNFIMDVVDIEHWNLLTREGSTVTAMNYDTHRQLFDDFRLTGLSNFDFFSSDYLQQKV